MWGMSMGMTRRSGDASMWLRTFRSLFFDDDDDVVFACSNSAGTK